MRVDTGGCTWALRRHLYVYTICLQFFLCQLLKVVIWTHRREHCAESLKISFTSELTHCGLTTVRVATEAKHQLHHLIEGAVTYGRSCAANLRNLLLLADATL